MEPKSITKTQKAAERIIRKFIVNRRITANTRIMAVLFVFWSLSLLVNIAMLCASLYTGGVENTFSSSQAGSNLPILLLTGIIFCPAAFRQFRINRRCKRTAYNSLERLRASGSLEQAVTELESVGGTVFGEGYRSGKYRTVLAEHFIFGSRMFSAADYQDLLWYYYQSGSLRHGQSAGYIIAYGSDRTCPYSFFLGTDNPEAAAKHAVQIISERNPSAIYGAENKDEYLALLEQAANN